MPQLFTGAEAKLELNARETVLLDAYRRLPTDAAYELVALAERLALIAPTRIDWADSWSDEDLRDFTRHSLERFEGEEESS